MNKPLEKVKTELELNEFIPEHERGFTVQTWGMLIMLLIVLSAALGAFGDGVLSKKVINKKDIEVDYQQFYRHEARMEVKVHFQNTQSQTIISFPADYIKDLQVENISPQAIENYFQNNRSHYVFKTDKSGWITFYFVPRKVGNLKGDININETSIILSHFIFP